MDHLPPLQIQELEFNPGDNVDSYTVVERFEGGHFGILYEVEDGATNEVYALKLINVTNGHLTANVLRELDILNAINHNCILRAERLFLYDNRHICIITKLMKEDLEKRMSQGGSITKETIKKWVKQLLDGIRELHAMDIIHRDLSANNVLLDFDENVKIADFGFARSLYNSAILTPDAGGARYSAPEVLLGAKNYGKAVDMWSLGFIFAQLVTRQTPFEFRQILIDDSSKTLRDAVLESIFRKLGTPEETMWPGVSSLPRYPPEHERVVHPVQLYDLPSTFDDADGRSMLEQLLQVVPSKRMTIEEALQHPYYLSP